MTTTKEAVWLLLQVESDKYPKKLLDTMPGMLNNANNRVALVWLSSVMSEAYVLRYVLACRSQRSAR